MSDKSLEGIYCANLFQYQRTTTSEVKIGNLLMGNHHPIRVQSMTTTNSLDTEASANQAIQIIEVGGELVRITAPGRREASNLGEIKKLIHQKGYSTPIVADIHFNPNAAEIAAEHVEKVRINPGNFADGAKKFENIEYTETEYNAELENIREKLIPFLNICKANNTAIRIGTNHGSLSDRIMSKYGDTPQGMVAACMEFLRICVEQNFYNIVLSIKASNTRIMVHTVRLLVKTMHEENMHFPIHLGVTEAGEGEDGRIKSAAGSGALLADGIGDTIRVSLTEDPEKEIPVAKKLVNRVAEIAKQKAIQAIQTTGFQPFEYQKRETFSIENIGGKNLPIVIADAPHNDEAIFRLPQLPDYYLIQEPTELTDRFFTKKFIVPYQKLNSSKSNYFPLYQTDEYLSERKNGTAFLMTDFQQLSTDLLSKIKTDNEIIIILKSNHTAGFIEQRAAFFKLNEAQIKNPVIIYRNYNESQLEDLQLNSAMDSGALFLDGFADGILLSNKGSIPYADIVKTAFGILQATRVRFTQTEYISCPGCGRTLYNLQETTAIIKAQTAHLKGLKIGIMGCIVNGPGEMADADYGYVGSGPGKITLYKKKEVMKKNVDEKTAVEELINLIKENGDWINP